MKKVRFESPVKPFIMSSMNDSECHSPRPYIKRQLQMAPQIDNLEYQVPFTNDPIQRFEYGNSSPYPTVSKMCLPSDPQVPNKWSPSNELDLSILDSSNDFKNTIKTSARIVHDNKSVFKINQNPLSDCRPLKSSHLENIKINPPGILNKNDDFFLRKDNLQGLKTLHTQVNKLHLGKENNPMLKKIEMINLGSSKTQLFSASNIQAPFCPSNMDNNGCRCHHCIKVCHMQHHRQQPVKSIDKPVQEHDYNICQCFAGFPKTHLQHSCNANYKCLHNSRGSTCSCNPNTETCQLSIAQPPLNSVDKKTWAIEKYGQINKTAQDQEVQKQSSIAKEKREPTVADLFKIIKLQNEQLQLLQEKVDKFISVNRSEAQKTTQPVQNYVTEHVALESMETSATKQKISIGVMTSFEMVRTSTIINKEIVAQNEAQIQCNRSQISIKEVISKQLGNKNFLDGITPVPNKTVKSVQCKDHEKLETGDLTKNTDQAQDEKTLNEISLYNVQVDNAITPDLSPEPSLYLDVRDYSDSDTSSDDQSNVGWTYYNKVMTHVNGMLQDSDMPSSASALYRNARQKCLQMQMDKTNISVTKRVTFGDDIAQQQQMQIPIPSTDTSLKMNQLAAKYLKNAPILPTNPRSPKAAADMSLATRNYMEKHNILQGKNYLRSQPQVEIPKFLDITALKQQPKFL